jgi:hypothetical protein
MNWVFIQRRFSGSLHSCNTAHGQKRAFSPDAVIQLCGLLTKKGRGVLPQNMRQEVLLAAPERVNRADTRFASAAHFERYLS